MEITKIPGVLGSDGASLMKGALSLTDDAAVIAKNRIAAGKKGKQAALNAELAALQTGIGTETAVDGVVNTVSTVVGIADPILGFGIPILGTLGGGLHWLGERGWFPGGRAIGGLLQKPRNFFAQESKLGFTNPKHLAEANKAIAETNLRLPAGSKPMDPMKAELGSDLWHASMVVGSAVQTYQVAHSYFQKRKILKMIRADMAADKAARHSAGGAGNTAALDAADSHISLEHGLRGLITAVGLALTWRMMRRGQFSMASFLVPTAANFGIDMFMGEDKLVDAYAPFREAYKHGQVSQQDYATFISAVSKDLHSRGAAGRSVAIKLAEHYAAEKASPARILNDVADGTFKKLIKDALAAGDAAAHAAHSHAAPLRADDVPMQDRLNGKKTLGPVVGDGKYTGKLHHKALEQDAASTIQHGLSQS